MNNDNTTHHNLNNHSFLSKSYFPFVIYAIVWAFMHTQMNLTFGDDLMFSSVLEGKTFWEWMIHKYLTFNTRVITESVLVLVLQIGILPWKIINLCMMIMIPVCISMIVFDGKADQDDNWAVVCLVSIYPFIDMATAGWGATASNYTWVLATGLFTLYCIKLEVNGKTVKPMLMILSIFSTIYAANVEQMACILLVFSTLAVILSYLRNKKISKYLCVILCTVVLDFLIIVLSPARTARSFKEIAHSFPSYEMLSFIDKITMGFTSTMAQFIGRKNWVFIAFSAILFAAVCKKEETTWIRITAGIPLVGGVLGFIVEEMPSVFPGIHKIFYYEAHARMPDFVPISAMNSVVFSAYIPLIVGIIVVGCILISLFFSFPNCRFVLPVLVVLAGLCSRMLMSFSPSIYESARRTYLLMYYGFIIAAIMIYRVVKEEHPVFSRKMVSAMEIMAIFPAVNTLLQVMTLSF